MMHFSTILASAIALAATSFAAPPGNGSLPQSTAQNIVDQYIAILAHPDVQAANATAQALLADNYEEISDSILSLKGFPLGQTTVSGKQKYINGVLNADPINGITTIQVLVAGCNQILWQWVFYGVGSGEFEVKGFNLFKMDNDRQKIETVYLEFDSVAWGLNNGFELIRPEEAAAR